jgi:hypothetical protein
MTYLFSKENRDERSDFETSYAFKVPAMGWLHLNKKAVVLNEYEDHYEVVIADWYLDNPYNKIIHESIKRRLKCERLQEHYLTLKKRKYDQDGENK